VITLYFQVIWHCSNVEFD